MSDFDATPIDEQASDLLDGNATADNPAVAGRVQQFASQKAAIVDVEPPTPAVRERLVAAALAAAPRSNVIPLRRRPILAAGAGLVAAAAAASLIFVVANRHNDSRLSASTAATTAAAATGIAPQVKAADTAAATEAATADLGAGTTAAAATTTAAASAAPAPAAFAGALADRDYNSPQELVAAYQAARDALAAPPPQATSVSATCSFAGERVGSITYQDTPAELFVTTDSFGRAHLTALAIEDCHRVIEVTVP